MSQKNHVEPAQKKEKKEKKYAISSCLELVVSQVELLVLGEALARIGWVDDTGGAQHLIEAQEQESEAQEVVPEAQVKEKHRDGDQEADGKEHRRKAHPAQDETAPLEIAVAVQVGQEHAHGAIRDPTILAEEGSEDHREQESSYLGDEQDQTHIQAKEARE